jgi:hypothetical protein
MSTREYLPPIDIAVSGTPRPFLEHIAKIADASGSFKIERHYDAMGTPGFDVLNLRYLKPSPHTKFGGQLIARSEVKGRVAVEMRAQAWRPDPPTYDSYCSAAKSVIGPLLNAYNRQVGTKHHLRIQSPRHIEPKLAPRSAKLFKKFALLANTSSLHPLDWPRSTNDQQVSQSMKEIGNATGEKRIGDIERLVGLVNGGAMSQAMSVGAELGVADLLASGPKSADQLAHAAGCDASSLRRLLRALASADLCNEHDDGSFSLTTADSLLRDAADFLRYWAIWWGRYLWPEFGNLLHSVKTGESARSLATQTIGLDHLEHDAEAAAIFNRAMTELTRVGCEFAIKRRPGSEIDPDNAVAKRDD